MEWVRGLQQIALAVEPRERYGLLLALVPGVALLRWTAGRSVLPRVATGLAVLAMGVLAARTTSASLDASARALAGPAGPLAVEEPAEIVWSARTLPRTAVWLRAMRLRLDVEPREPPVSPVECAAWSAPAPVDG